MAAAGSNGDGGAAKGKEENVSGEKHRQDCASSEMLAELLMRNLHEDKLNVSYIESLLEEVLEIIKGKTLRRNGDLEERIDYKNYII